MSTTLIRVHEDTKKCLDEYINKKTRTYDAIVQELDRHYKSCKTTLLYSQENLGNVYAD